MADLDVSRLQQRAYRRAVRDCIAAVEMQREWWRDAHHGTDHLVVGERNNALEDALAALRALLTERSE